MWEPIDQLVYLKIFLKNSNVLAFEPSFYALKIEKNLNLNSRLEKRINYLIHQYLILKNKNSSYSSWKLDFNKNSHPVHKGILKEASKKTVSKLYNEKVKK